MIGVVLLAHEQPRRTAQLARHMATQGCRVVVHVDARASDKQMHNLEKLFDGIEGIALAPQLECEWGTFSLIEASLSSVRLMFDRWPEVSHIIQLSGACLPIRPISELRAHLEAHRDVDFIEAVSLAEDEWVIGGLSMERFTLYHPLSWRKHRWLFDQNVRLQRALKIRRKLPAGLVPHMGSQWWCLSRQTLDLILNDPQLPEYCRYFKTTWIPDESFFQTLAAKHSDRITRKPLTFVRFDAHGKPYVFYDDHLDLLLHANGFFARKIWRGAQKLYDTFLDPNLEAHVPATRAPGRLRKRFEEAQKRHRKGRKGLVSHGRHSGRYRLQHQTAGSYVVIDGLDHALPGLSADLAAKPDVIVHGFVFDREKVEFAEKAPRFTGNLSAVPEIRDYERTHFLSKMIWAERTSLQSFRHRLRDDHWIDAFILRDPNAYVIWLEDGWLLRLFRDFPDGLSRADTAFHKAITRAAHVAEDLSSKDLKAQILPISLADLLTGGVQTADEIARFMPEQIGDAAIYSAIKLPEGFGIFLAGLLAENPEDTRMAALAKAVAAHENMRRVLRRKT